MDRVPSPSGKSPDRYADAWRKGAWVSWVLLLTGVVPAFLIWHRWFGSRTIVLTYHKITDDFETTPEIVVTPITFRKQIRFIRALGTFVTPSRCLDLPARKGMRFVITFDDGYEDNYTNALPVLREATAPAAIFLISSQIGNEGFLDAGQIDEMQSHGIEFGAHTVSHPRLADLDRDGCELEVRQSVQEVEAVVGRRCTLFAYPYGKPEQVGEIAPEVVSNAGVELAFTTINGPITAECDAVRLPRIGIRECSLVTFAARISGVFESRAMRFLKR
ncbi:MAG: polysaccharide deacetylase family protein [Armatimonadetes bacterium]|nr:polysaccharide deacetylase family protein [Armatimonadota bacterium]